MQQKDLNQHVHMTMVWIWDITVKALTSGGGTVNLEAWESLGFIMQQKVSLLKRAARASIWAYLCGWSCLSFLQLHSISRDSILHFLVCCSNLSKTELLLASATPEPLSMLCMKQGPLLSQDAPQPCLIWRGWGGWYYIAHSVFPSSPLILSRFHWEPN